MRNILIIGHSHINCIKAAAQGVQNVAFINMRVDNFDTKNIMHSRPDFVGLSIRGNAHNVLTLFENPVRFTSGGLQLDKKERVSIPTAQLRAVLYSGLHWIKDNTLRMHARFPDARFAYICPPPPIFATDNVINIPEIFEDVAKNGYAPDELRIFVYNMQTEYYEALADETGAVFIRPPAKALTDDGMLALQYCSHDPTHGNKKYGQMVLQQVMEWEKAR